MNATAGATVVSEGNPLLHAALAREHLERYFSVCDKGSVMLLVSALNAEHLAKVAHFNVKELTGSPLRVLVAVVADTRAPVLESAGVEMDEGVHLMEGSTELVVEMSLKDVDTEVTCLGEANHLDILLQDQNKSLTGVDLVWLLWVLALRVGKLWVLLVVDGLHGLL